MTLAVKHTNISVTSLQPFDQGVSVSGKKAPMRLMWISSDILQRIWIIFFIITVLVDDKSDCFMFYKNGTRPTLQTAQSDSAHYFLKRLSSQTSVGVDRVVDSRNDILFELLKANDEETHSNFQTFSKRILDMTNRVALKKSMHDINQVRKKRDFQYEESFKACPSIKKRDALEYAYLGGSLTRVKVEQPLQGTMQRFPTVLCNNTPVTGRPSNCTNCCIGIDQRSYHSQCRTENITYPAAVRMPNASSSTGWSSTVVTKKITFPGSCVCSLSEV